VGQVAVVTGATSGIGLATARQLGQLGARIAVVHRDPAGLMRAQAALDSVGAGYLAVAADLASADQVLTIVPRVVDELGSIDILINCAGIAASLDFLGQTLEEWDNVLAVNLRAPFLLLQAVARQMIAQGHGGRIVNISSSSAFRAELAPPAYVSSKGGLSALTRSAAGALGRYDINVNGVVPGMTATPMVVESFGTDAEVQRQALSFGPLHNLLGRMSQPEDVAEMICFLCLPASRQLTGQLIHVSAGAVV
jgi:NAD(P)-dependent dehydrogenase (short-subunit alcohol dehydrogenase family)